MAYARAILSRLKNVKPAKPVAGQNSWTAQCPAHDDRKNVLAVTVSRDGQRLGIKCAAGCLESLILAAVDLSASDLILSASGKPKKAADAPAKKASTPATKTNVVSLADRKASLEMAAEREYKGGNFITERAILGSILINPALLAKVRAAHILKDFQLESSRIILNAMLALDDQGIEPNIVTVNAHLYESGEVEAVGGGAYVSSLSDGIPFTDQIASYCRMVKVLAEKHRAAQKLEAARIKLEDGADPRDVLKKLRASGRPLPTAPPPELDHRGMVHGVVRDWWIEQHPPTIWARGQFYRYDTGLWKPIEDGGIENEVDAVIDRLESKQLKATGATLSSVVHKARAALWIASDRLDANPDLVVFTNGVLNLSDGRWSEHNPDLYVTSGVDFAYDRKAKAPAWRKYLARLAESLGQDVIDFLQEFIGLSLTGGNKFEISVWLYGKRGAGKGTFIDGVKAAMSNRVCLVSLADMDQSRFMMGDIPGKTLAISQEEPGGRTRSMHLLNKLISNEECKIDIKHSKPITFTPVCSVLMACTRLPKAVDAGDGIFRRAAVIPFPPLDFDGRDPGVKEAIKKEGAGIFNWANEGLKRLRDRGRFVLPGVVLASMRHFAEASDIEGHFLRECAYVGAELEAVLKGCIGKPRRGELSAVLYRAYADWCKAGNQYAKSSTDVRAEWIRLGLHLYESKGREHWGSIRLKGSDGLPDYSPLLDHGDDIETHRI